jgi:NTP pyrophosphatase (non-canonical NTP hydrolase)
MNDTPTAAPMHEDFLTQLRRVAADRMTTWCSETELPCALFHATELGGEVGEVLNVVKKLHREASGWRGSRATVADLAEEIGDVVVCLDKLAAYYGIDLAQATAAKFNATSEKVGLAHRLHEGATPAPMFTFSADVGDKGSEAYRGQQSDCLAGDQAIKRDGQFLLDRLVDHEVRMTSEQDAREWHGHVTPAMARFRVSLADIVEVGPVRTSRFDPPGLWESEPRSIADDAGQVNAATHREMGK